ncbi:MAG: PhoH family protein [Planctomycetaceae bacterium]|jgi:phosphate starvation-inducible protein PhoH and related proteins|nr:PhoH family protein [Planctomycetaceae bacterium]MBT7256978.1 PhoH family protein [Planctomycetaceae bacterium]
MFEATLPFSRQFDAIALFGVQDQNLRLLREQLDVSISLRDGLLHVTGDESIVADATKVLERMKDVLQHQGVLTLEGTQQVMTAVLGNQTKLMDIEIDVMDSSHRIAPRTAGQALYVQAIRDSDLVFAVGPAGTGKTFLAVAMAVEALKHQDVRRIVLVRPAVEAGESLGYLPGDLHAKINPYLRPLFDALQSLVGFDTMKQFMEQDIIEVVPLAYMRGRTLDQAFIILDEAQNTTASQMKMFLTRMGADSKIVVSGDATQIDLPLNTPSGLIDATRRLAQIQGVSSLELTAADIVRHPLVQKIVSAYETRPEKLTNNRNQKRS